jgi:hypothetical protein
MVLVGWAGNSAAKRLKDQNGSGGSKVVYKQLQTTESALVQMRWGSGVREPLGTVRAGLTFELGSVSSEL